MSQWHIWVVGSLLTASPILFGQPSPQEALTLKRITEFWKDGDYASAKSQILDFLAKNPQTEFRDQLKAMLGDLYLQEHNFRQAVATYDQIKKPEIYQKIAFNQIHALFELKHYPEVVEKAELLMKTSTDKQQDRTRYLLAESLYRLALKEESEENKNSLLKRAKIHYKLLIETELADRALFPLAEIFRVLKEDENAASLYVALSNKYPEHKEKFLFQAGVLKIRYNPEEALGCFQTVSQMQGKRAGYALYNQLLLLYQLGKYDEFLSLYHQRRGELKERSQILEFYKGRVCYALQDYKGATEALEKAAAQMKRTSREFKVTLLLLINCAKHLKDLPILERAISSFKMAFPDDPQLPKAIVMHAEIVRESGDLEQSLNDLRAVFQEYSNFDGEEEARFDYGLLLAEARSWSESRENFLQFVKKFPYSSKKQLAWKYLLQSFSEELKEAPLDQNISVKERLIDQLQDALETDTSLTLQERDLYSLALMKSLLEQGHYEHLEHLIDEKLQNHGEDSYLAQLHLLKATAAQKIENGNSLFILHAEKALLLDPDLADRQRLHLELYNTYLKIALSETEDGYKKELFDHAAEHLFNSETWLEGSMKIDNYLWLTDHYYQNVKSNNQEPLQLERALRLYDHLFDLKGGKLEITHETLFLERELLKYVELLSAKGENSKQLSLLEALVEKQDAFDFSWKWRDRAHFQLGQAYEQHQRLHEALTVYQKLIQNSETLGEAFMGAKLHASKIEYGMILEEERTMENAKLVSILHTLKDLQIQKHLPYEPIHLEAALNYAKIRGELASDESHIQAHLFFLKRIKEDFSLQDDPLSQEYEALRKKYTDKDLIVQSYMLYIDAEILKWQAELAYSQNDQGHAQELYGLCLRHLEELLAHKERLGPYLVDHINSVRVSFMQKS